MTVCTLAVDSDWIETTSELTTAVTAKLNVLIIGDGTDGALEVD